MSGDTLRRAVLCMLMAALLLPATPAFATPAKPGRNETAAPRAWEWSRLLQPVQGLLSLFEQATSIGNDPTNDPKNTEGNGIDPHGSPKP